MTRLRPFVLAGITLAMLTACGGGGDGVPGAPGKSNLFNVSDEAADANCEHGGKRASAGADFNGNDVLDTHEVSTTNYICADEQSAELPWVHTTDTAVQATPNTGYLADNVDQVTVTLPANPALGDVIHVTGVGAGGWKIAQNAGQTILTHNLAGGRFGETWTARKIDEAGTPLWWGAVASSADGMKLVAAARGGHIYTSTDAGVTWTARETSRHWRAVASSADGTHLVAAAHYEDQVHTSNDSGVTWTARTVPNANTMEILWANVSSSTSGREVVAASSGSPKAVFLSHDFGATWQAVPSAGDVLDVAVSADGSGLVTTARPRTNQPPTDSAHTRTSDEAHRTWESIASSADGTRLIAAEFAGHIYTSTPLNATSTSFGTSGYISARQHDSVELQYVGNDTFMVRSSSGDFAIR